MRGMVMPEGLALRRMALVAVGCGLAVFVGKRIPEQPILMLLLLGGLGYLISLAVNVRWLAWLVLATVPSAIIVPGLPGRPFAWEACTAALWISLPAYLAINQQRGATVPLGRDEKRMIACLGVFLVVLVLLMLTRGVGFRAFGGEQMGGRFYAQQLVLVLLPVTYVLLPWRERFLLSTFLAGAALSVTYLVSDLALIRGGRLADFILFFLELPTDAINFYFGFEMSGLRRLQSLAAVGSSLFAVVLVVFPLGRLLHWRGLWLWPLPVGRWAWASPAATARSSCSLPSSARSCSCSSGCTRRSACCHWPRRASRASSGCTCSRRSCRRGCSAPSRCCPASR